MLPTRLLGAVVTVLFCSLAITHGITQNIPEALREKIADKTTLKEVMQEVEAFYKEPLQKAVQEEQEDDFENPLSFWFRWERYMAPRLNPKGELINYGYHLTQQWDKLQAAEKQNPEAQNTLSRWSFVGPDIMNYHAGQYRGLGRLDCMAFHPTNANIMWVGSPAGGVWKTLNGGVSWVCISFNMPTMAVSSIAVSPTNPDIIYILTGDPNGGSFRGLYNRNNTNAGTFVWKTTDGGYNWIRCETLPNAPNWGAEILIDPTNSNNIYVAHSAGFSRSTNGGISFTTTALAGGAVTDIKLKPGTPTTIYAATNGGVLVSTNSGASFTTSTATPALPAGRKLLAVSPANTSVVYLLCSGIPASPASGQFNGLYRSDNSGSTFTRQSNTPNIYTSNTEGNGRVDFSYYCYALAANPTNANNVIAAGTIIWGSTNGGATLTNYTDYAEDENNMGRYVHPDIHGLAFNPLNGILYSTNDGGLWRSNNNGVAWTDASANLHVSTFYSLAGFAGNANLLAGGNQDNGVKYRNPAVPYAADFTHVAGGDGFDAAFDASNSNRWYCSGNANLYRFNQGNLEKVINPPGVGAAGQIDYYPTVATCPSTANRLFVLYETGIFSSENAGDSWWNVSAGMVTGNRSNSHLVIAPSNINRVYATNGASLWRTNDGGANWSGNLKNNTGFNTTVPITQIAVWSGNADVIYAAVGGVQNPGRKVYYSTNGGDTWQNISGTLPDVPVLSIAVDAGNNCYIGTDLGVFYQASTSTDWTPYYNGLPRIPISDLVINQGASKIRAATYGHGVWEAPLFANCLSTTNLSGPQASNQFFEVSNKLLSNAEISGGSGTQIIYRAGNEVVLYPGFTVYEHNNFRAYLGPCQSSPTPLVKVYQQPWASQYALPLSTTSLVPYGSLKLARQVDTSLLVQYQLDSMQLNYTLAITTEDADEWLVQKPLEGTTLSGNTTIPVGLLPPGRYLVQLYAKGRLVHYQQWQKQN